MLVPLAVSRPDSFEKLRDAADAIFVEKVPIKHWYPHPVKHEALTKTLQECTAVQTVSKDIQSFSLHFTRGNFNFAPGSGDYNRILRCWPTGIEKPLDEGSLDTAAADISRGRANWLAACRASLKGEASLPMPKSWQGFVASDGQDVEGMEEDDDPNQFPERSSFYPEITPDMEILVGCWWRNDTDQRLRQAVAILEENTKDMDDGYEYEDIFEAADARPGRIMLIVKDDTLPALIDADKFTHSEFSYAVAYMHFMQASPDCALLLITLFGDRAVRIIDVCWEDPRLVFRMLPMLDLGKETLEDLDKTHMADPWIVVSWLCCRPSTNGKWVLKDIPRR